MGQRVRDPHRGQSPSSVTQLPILTALHARAPTLFELMIHDFTANVNPPFTHFGDFLFGGCGFVGFPQLDGLK